MRFCIDYITTLTQVHIKIFNKNTLKEQISDTKYLIIINNLGSSIEPVLIRFMFFKMISFFSLSQIVSMFESNT